MIGRNGDDGLEVTTAIHSYEVRPREDHRGFDLISDALPFGTLWYAEPNGISNAIGHAKRIESPLHLDRYRAPLDHCSKSEVLSTVDNALEPS
jgi:hypothetical protein